MDYGKYKYEAAQRAKDSRKKSTNIVVKELKYRPKIAKGDLTGDFGDLSAVANPESIQSIIQAKKKANEAEN